MTRPSTHLVELPGFRLGVRSGPAARRGRTGQAAAGRAPRAVRELQGVMKSLVVCCDGTWNDPANRDDGEPAPTNVFKLFNAVDLATRKPRQLTRYQAGVGTGGPLDRLLGGAMGFGLGEDIRDCYHWLATKYEPGDRLFLFGFSRVRSPPAVSPE